jgi:hypothetical protein
MSLYKKANGQKIDLIKLINEKKENKENKN